MQDKSKWTPQDAQQLSKEEMEHIQGGTFADPAIGFDGVDGESHDRFLRPARPG